MSHVTTFLTEVAEIAKQRNATTWRITLKGSLAEVVAFTGATQTLEGAEQFVVIRGPAGLLLTRNDARLSIQTITIDPSNSSFVYSGQDVNLLMNKTNIFVGSCRPYLYPLTGLPNTGLQPTASRAKMSFGLQAFRARGG